MNSNRCDGFKKFQIQLIRLQMIFVCKIVQKKIKVSFRSLQKTSSNYVSLFFVVCKDWCESIKSLFSKDDFFQNSLVGKVAFKLSDKWG